MFIEGTPEIVSLSRSVLRCLKELHFVTVLELGNPIVPQEFAVGRGRVDEFIIETQVPAINVVKALVGFLNTFVHFYEILPSPRPSFSRKGKRQFILLILGRYSLLLPAGIAKQRTFFKHISSPTRQSSRKTKKRKT